MPTPIPIHGGSSGSGSSPTEHPYPNMSDGRRGSLFGTSITAPMSFGGNSLGGSFAPMSISGNSYGRSPFTGGQSFRFYAAGTSASSWRGGAGGFGGFGGTGMSYGRDSAMDSFDPSMSKFGTSVGSDHAGVAPGSLRANQLESTFCRNFTCCGLELPDLHDLLQHYEEQHVRLDDAEDVPPPGMIHDDGSSEQSSNSSNPSSPAAAAAAAAAAAQAQANGARPLSANAAALAAVNQRKRAMNAFNAPSSSSTGPGLGGLQSSLRHLSTPRRSGSPFAGAVPEETSNSDPLLGLAGGSQAATSRLGALSLRSQGQDDHGLPSCAPPNLFFPANGAAAQAAAVGMAPGTAPSTPHSRAATPKPPSSSAGAGSQRTSPSADPGTGAQPPKFDTKSVVVTPGNVDKPYKCPSPGCDKAYKQMNGLKYHRVHGHCNQNLLAPPAPTTSSPATPATPTAAHQGPGPLTPHASPGMAHPSAVSTTSSPGHPPIGQRVGPLFGTTAPPVATTTPANVVATSSGAGAAGPSLGALPPGTAPGAPPSLLSAPLGVQGQQAGGFFGSLPPAQRGGAPAASTAPGPGLAGVPLDARSLYVCQVGTCGKTYKNLNGLRYHYLHSGSHGLLGLQVLHAHGGGSSAKMGVDGKAVVSTATLAPEEVARAARLAAEMQAKKAHVTQRTVEMIQAQALAGGGPGHNHKQAQEMQAIVDADTAPQFDHDHDHMALDAMDTDL